jgi:hypothetical protein
MQCGYSQVTHTASPYVYLGWERYLGCEHYLMWELVYAGTDASPAATRRIAARVAATALR